MTGRPPRTSWAAAIGEGADHGVVNVRRDVFDGRYIPPPPQPFQGVIKLNALQSTPAWPARVVPPKGISSTRAFRPCASRSSPTRRSSA